MVEEGDVGGGEILKRADAAEAFEGVDEIDLALFSGFADVFALDRVAGELQEVVIIAALGFWINVFEAEGNLQSVASFDFVEDVSTEVEDPLVYDFGIGTAMDGVAHDAAFDAAAEFVGIDGGDGDVEVFPLEEDLHLDEACVRVGVVAACGLVLSVENDGYLDSVLCHGGIIFGIVFPNLTDYRRILANISELWGI